MDSEGLVKLMAEINSSARDLSRADETVFDCEKISSAIPPSIPGAETLRVTISRKKMITAFGDTERTLTGLRAGPYRAEGKITGYRLIRVPESNILHESGLRSGDIIRRINGEDLDSTEKLYNVWTCVKNADRIFVEIESSGKFVLIIIMFAE
jgi:type II secretory pathway component PulC